jgi:gliding motility-associated protein GldM
MAGKETPRQKMIGMMYLVLTALLALNVSDEVLNAFKLVNDGLETTTSNFATTNKITYGAFEAAMKNNPGKTKPFYDKALLAQKYTSDLNKYVEDLKKEFLETGGGIDEQTGDIVQRKDIDISAQIMINQGKGKELKTRILDTRKKLLDLVAEKDRPNFNFSLNAVDPGPDKEGTVKTWESSIFEGTPLTAANTLLSKIQNDIKNAEADVVSYLLKSVDATDFKFDQLNAVVVAPTSYVLVGQQYEADVFLTAYDSKQAPEIVVGGRTLTTEEGKGKYRVVPTSEGMVKWGGVIKVKSPDGTSKDYKFESEYQAAKPSATISADKMNVFYIGVDNPVSISAPGIAKTKLRPTLQGDGTITGSNGSYTVRVTKPGKVMVTVSGEISKGEYKTLGGMEYRVKRVPDPVAKVGGMMSGNMSAGQLRSQKGVFAVLDNFDFDLKFNVKRFDLIVIRARQDPQRLMSNGAALTPEMVTALNGLGPKDKVFFSEIIAAGPDGTNRKLNDVVINVQ